MKFDVASDWALPDVGRVVPDCRIEVVNQHLMTTYYDTPSRDLFAVGVTLRRRTGDADEGWQLKVPDGDARIEVRAELNGRGVPHSLRQLIAGVRSGEPLKALATIATERTVHRMLDGAGTSLAEIADDRVSATVYSPRRRRTTWREVEVELAGGDEDLLERSGQELIGAGATPSSAPSKLARALYRPHPDPSPDVSLGALIRRYVTEQVDALLRNDIDLRREQDVVHPTRVAIRRLRSALRVYADVFEPARAAELDTELSWFAGLLGDVRDREVLRLHLDEAVRGLSSEVVVGPVLARIDRILGGERDAAKLTLLRAMSGQRYFALTRELKAWRDDPAFAGGAEPGGSIAARVDAASAKARQRVKAAARHAGDEHAMHHARKAAKRARYCAELAEPRMGKKARTVIAEFRLIQDRLGAAQDSVIASNFLLRAAREAEAIGESPFTFGVLWAREQQHALEAGRDALR